MACPWDWGCAPCSSSCCWGSRRRGWRRRWCRRSRRAAAVVDPAHSSAVAAAAAGWLRRSCDASSDWRRRRRQGGPRRPRSVHSVCTAACDSCLSSVGSTHSHCICPCFARTLGTLTGSLGRRARRPQRDGGGHDGRHHNKQWQRGRDGGGIGGGE